MIRDFKPGPGNQTLIARITGRQFGLSGRSAGGYCGPSMPTVKLRRLAHRATGDLDIILVSDVDVLIDRFWVSTRNFFGRQVSTPVAGNGTFVVAALDALAGDSALLDLRGRGMSTRPFVVIDNLERAAEHKFRAKSRNCATTGRHREKTARPDRAGRR